MPSVPHWFRNSSRKRHSRRVPTPPSHPPHSKSPPSPPLSPPLLLPRRGNGSRLRPLRTDGRMPTDEWNRAPQAARTVGWRNLGGALCAPRCRRRLTGGRRIRLGAEMWAPSPPDATLNPMISLTFGFRAASPSNAQSVKRVVYRRATNSRPENCFHRSGVQVLGTAHGLRALPEYDASLLRVPPARPGCVPGPPLRLHADRNPRRDRRDRDPRDTRRAEHLPARRRRQRARRPSRRSRCSAPRSTRIVSTTGDIRRTEQGLDALWEKPTIDPPANWRAPYLRKPVPLDPWGRPYVYLFPGQVNPQGYDLLVLRRRRQARRRGRGRRHHELEVGRAATAFARMPTYAYQAVDGSGKRTRGQAQAVSSGALARTLEERGLFVLDVAESARRGGGGGAASGSAGGARCSR